MLAKKQWEKHFSPMLRTLLAPKIVAITESEMVYVLVSETIFSR